MKTIGLLGGMSWESTIGYYRAINQEIKTIRGGLHSARIVLYSVDFAHIAKLQKEGDWQKTAELLSDAARGIQSAGADCLLICTNTMHKVAPQIETALKIPLLHIADATAEVLVENGIERVGLLGTAYTMEQDFYKGHLNRKYGLDVLIPETSERKIIHDVIFKELCLGQCRDASKKAYLKIIDTLAQNGAQAIILGCTEIGMLIDQSDTPVKLFDTTALHAQKAVQFALDRA